MCGIVGVAAFQGASQPSDSQIRSMNDAIYHRGPDAEGKDIQKGVGLGMRRLSIIDVEGGHQPYFNEDHSIRAVFNGEIYNFKEVRAGLESQGHRFSSRADGEVIVHLWEKYGIDFPKHLNGMFAIALHDLNQNRLVLVRDRVGIKPLFYYLTNDHLVFGSEIKAILKSGLVHRELDLNSLNQFFSWEYIPGKDTLFKKIQKLTPATLLDIYLDSRDIQTRTWWDIPSSNGHSSHQSEKEWEEELDATFSQCVKRHLVSDVPLGAFLSGGVDSSLMTAKMGSARTFSIGFDDPSYNETQWSKRVADHLGLSHRIEMIRPNAVELFSHLMNYMEDPIGDFSIFPTYLVSRLAREEVKVVLSGDGGDELFGGYETYVANRIAKIWNRVPAFFQRSVAETVGSLRPQAQKRGMVNKTKRFFEGLDHSPILSHARWRLFLGDETRQNLFTSEALESITSSAYHHIVDLFSVSRDRHELDQSLYVDLKSYLSDNILVKMDRMSMATSLEVRVPYLDHELVEFAFRVPASAKLKGVETKAILKKVAARHLPKECLYRPKQGFSIPIKNWLTQEFRPLLEELLHPNRLKTEGVLQAETVESLKKEHLEGRVNHSHLLWSLLVFQDWRTRWKV